MNYKYTSDGRKVAVIGSLNAKETIVQEVFVADGTEFPAGEHFVVKTLLDAPAKTYKQTEELRLAESIKKLEAERDKLSREIDTFRIKSEAAQSRVNWSKGITDDEVASVIDRIRAMVRGEYTHVVFLEWTIEIKEWDHLLFADIDTYSGRRFDGVKLVSLFGNYNNNRLDMSWMANAYRDGSGTNRRFVPCKSLQEAVKIASDAIADKKDLSNDDYSFCVKYGILVDPEKNSIRIKKNRDSITDRIQKSVATVEELKRALSEMERESK